MKPKPFYRFEELFAYLLQYQAHKNKALSFGELDFLSGDSTQPLSLNFISHKKTWHVPLTNFECHRMFLTMLDKSKYKDCNNHIFTDINPEEKYKIKSA